MNANSPSRRPEANRAPALLNRDQLSGLAVGLFAGLLVALLAGLFGYQIGRAGRVFRDDGEPLTAAPTAPAPTPGAPAPAPAPAPAAGAGGVSLDAAQQITAATQVVQTDPRNRQAWVTLGNLYFDSHQPQKSIDAYAHALELQPDDPDVLTDQGVMFRAAGAYDKAIANFQKANRLRPEHLQSLYNLGVVYGFDLKDVPRAEEAWNKLIQLAPSSENAAQARAALAQLKGK